MKFKFSNPTEIHHRTTVAKLNEQSPPAQSHRSDRIRPSKPELSRPFTILAAKHVQKIAAKRSDDQNVRRDRDEFAANGQASDAVPAMREKVALAQSYG